MASCSVLVHNERFLRALSSTSTMSAEVAATLVINLLSALETVVSNDDGIDGPLDAAPAIARSCSGPAIAASISRSATCGPCSGSTKQRSNAKRALSTVSTPPELAKRGCRPRVGADLFLAVHAEADSCEGADIVVSLALVADMNRNLLARITANHLAELAGRMSVM